jgi:hypothetical protein
VGSIQHFAFVEHIGARGGFATRAFPSSVLATMKCHGWELVLDGLYCSRVLIFSASSAVSFLLGSNALVEWRFRATEMISITTPGDEIRPLAGAKESRLQRDAEKDKCNSSA